MRSMHPELRHSLLEIAKERLSGEDPSHDLAHSQRVLALVEYISDLEGGDPDVLVPSALFHDIVNPPKNSQEAAFAAENSARAAVIILSGIPGYPPDKIAAVASAISAHSFNSATPRLSLEARILRDADALEATGAIAIMRTFSSTGTMNRPFYHPDDPFAEHRAPDDRAYALDLFYTRLLQIGQHLHTSTARRLAQSRLAFLEQFLSQLHEELSIPMTSRTASERPN